MGGKGEVYVDGEVFELDKTDALYVGKGNNEILVVSNDAENPALVYLNSAPAREAYPTKKIGKEEAVVINL